MCQARSSTAAPQSTSSRASASSLANTPVWCAPSATTNGAGQRGHVDDDRGLEAPRVVERIAQDEAAFGVGVEDLDGETGGAGDDVARLDGAAVRHVFAGGHEADDVAAAG